MAHVIDQLSTALADRYAIERELGAGGMATVYLARDLKHDRKVALKVLRSELAAVIGAERFLAEIKVTANLQHPHILPLHDSGEAGGRVFYVMPYVEGESLRDRLDREQQLPVDDAVRLTREIAGALDYAHRQGVIHRDIKPENILLHDGAALVADFGIALAVSHAGGSRMTETGMSLGTPHYMSPEQAMGDRELTARSDVYALGATLYEMLAGEPPFTGPSAQAIVARVMTETPRGLRSQRHTVPEHVEAAVIRALEKLPADRFGTAAEFAQALVTAGATDAGPAPRAAGPASRRAAARWWTGWAVAGGLAVAAAAGWLRPAPETPADPVRFTLDFAGQMGSQSIGAGGIMSDIVISPDARTIVYVGPGEPETLLYRRRLDRLEWEPIAGTNDADSPFFSPDGRWLGFRQGNRLRKVDLVTGAIVTLTTLDRSSLISGAGWTSADTIFLALEAIAGLYMVSADGGQLRQFETQDSVSLFNGATLLPGEDWILTTLFPEDRGTVTVLAAISLRTGEVRPLVEGARGAAFLPGNRMVYLLADDTPVTAPLDPADPQPTSERTPVVESIAVLAGGNPQLSVAPNGTAVFLRGGSAENTVVLVDRQGRETPLLSAPREYKDPRFAPDGRRLAYEIREGNNEGDIWIHEFARATAARLTFGSENLYPVWTPDGRRVAFTSRRSGIAGLWWKAADASGDAEALIGGTELRFPGAFTPDGRILLYRETAPTTGFDIYALPLDGDRTPVPVVVSSFNEVAPALSPNGRWLAFVSDQSGRNEVYVRAFPDGETDYQISAGGGTEPAWDPRGRGLYYRRGGTLWQASLTTGDRVGVVRRDSLFTGTYLENLRWSEYDVHPDGDGFVFIKLGRNAMRPVVVLNWAEDLARQAAGREGL